MRLLTKEQRNQSRDYQFTALTNSGYIRTDYKDRVFFHHPNELILKAFKGNAANHYHFVRYRTIERLMEDMERQKGNADMNEKWKAEQKERNKGHKSSHAAAAQQIREKLKAAFPDVKFSVTSDSYSGGNSVHVEWTDGPNTSMVEEISGAYQYGSFDGMTDMYNNTNDRDDIPQVKYVQERREMSVATREFITSQLTVRWGDQLQPYEIERRTYQIFTQAAIPVGATLKAVEIIDGDEVLTFEPKESPIETIERPAAPTLQEGQTIAVIKYSDKSIAVTGEGTREIKEQLKALGGKFNFRLTCGAGWIFPATKQQQVIELLKEIKQGQETIKEELREEVKQCMNFFEETDLQIYGQVQPCTMQIIKVQKGETANV